MEKEVKKEQIKKKEEEDQKHGFLYTQFKGRQTEPSGSLYTSTSTAGASRGSEGYYKPAGQHAGFNKYLPHTQCCQLCRHCRYI